MNRNSTLWSATLVLALALPLSATLPAQEAKPPAHPFTKKHLYDEEVDPKVLIAQALKQAKAEHKRVILDFGGDWCGDCQVLDIYFHDDANQKLLNDHFVVVHVFIGHKDKNLDIAEKYGVPMGDSAGVPALAVLNANGKVIYSQQHKEFSSMRYMDSQSVTEFLNRWKG